LKRAIDKTPGWSAEEALEFGLLTKSSLLTKICSKGWDSLMYISFAKYHGSGNDFIIIDDRAGVFPIENDQLISKICHRRFGIGADGLLLLQTSACAGFRVRIVNSDGKEVGMCGNGMRCFVHYLHSLGFKEDVYRVETMHDIIECQIKGDNISVRLQKPYVINWDVKA
jgi:diaminopimelate epimerase